MALISTDFITKPHENVEEEKESEVFLWGAELARYNKNLYTKHRTQSKISLKHPMLSVGVRSVDCGRSHVMICTRDGSILAYGHNDFSQCGIEATQRAVIQQLTPVKFPEMARSVACGSAYTLIATESGVLYGCGLRDLLAQPSPIRKKDRQDTGLIPIGPFYDEQCVAVTVCAARNDYSCVSSGQDLWHFGYCRYLATCLKRPKPLELDIEGASVRKISVGAFSGALLSTKGKIYVWGDGTHSELGGIPYSQAPVELKQEERFLDVACGENHTIAVSQSGGLYVVGDNTASQCGAESFARGYGGKRVTEFLSVQPTCPFSGFAVSVCAGNQHSTLLTNMHRLYLWGSNTEGKLGHSSKVSRENQRINTLSLCYRLINRTVEAVAAKNNATVIICSPARDDEVSSGEESEEEDKSEKKFRMKSKVIPGARIVKSAVGITRIVDLPKTDKDHDTAKYFNDLSMYTSPEYGSCFEGNSLGDCSPSAASSSPVFMSQTTPGITTIGDWISLQSGSIMAKNRGLIQMNSEVARFVRNRQVTNKACDSRGITERRRMVTNLPDRPTSPRDQYLELEDDVIDQTRAENLRE